MENKTTEVVEVVEAKKGMSTIKKVLIGVGATVGLGIVGLLVTRKDKPIECQPAEQYERPQMYDVTDYDQK